MLIGLANGEGSVSNVVVKNVHLDRVNAPLHVYQTNGGHTSAVKNTADSAFVDH